MSSRTNDEAIYPNSGSMGWFFGFKLDLICNEKGALLNFMIMPGDVDDRKHLEYKAFIEFYCCPINVKKSRKDRLNR